MPLPPLRTQRAIADFLDAETARIDALITKKRDLVALCADRFQSMVTDRLDPLADRYGSTQLRAVAQLRVSNVDKKTYEGEPAVRLCNYTDVFKNRRIDSSFEFMAASASHEQIARFTLRRGDVLITKDSETADEIGIPALVVEDVPGVVLGYHLALLRPTAIDGSFLYWALCSRRARDAFSLAASGVTRFGLRQDAIGRVPVPRLDRARQIAVAEGLEREAQVAEKVAAVLNRQIALLQERRQALITAAVTGEIAVPGAAA